MVPLPSGRTYEVHFRQDIKPHQCLIRGCTRTAELAPKAWRSQAWRLTARKPGDAIMGQAEWEFWDTQHFGSYCALHKCIMEGCNMGMKFDETGCLFNMCAYHSHKFALREITKDDNAKKKRLSLSRIMETVFSSSSPKPQLKVQDQLPQRVAGTGEIVRLHEECTADTCQRLQIVDSRGVGGSCELHTEFPVLPDSVKDAEGGIPPLARVFVVDATGRMREIGEQVGAIAAVGAGALQLVSSAISIISMGMVG